MFVGFFVPCVLQSLARSGTIPDELGTLAVDGELKEVDLSDNFFEGMMYIVSLLVCSAVVSRLEYSPHWKIPNALAP